MPSLILSSGLALCLWPAALALRQSAAEGTLRQKPRQADLPVAANCDPLDSMIAFSDPRELSDNPPERDEFLKLMESGPLAETLCFTRHQRRACPTNGLNCPKDAKFLPVPKAMRSFEWRVLGHGEHGIQKDVPNPKSVYCVSKALDTCLELAQELPKLRRGMRRVLAMGNDDSPLRKAKPMVEKILKTSKFSRVLYEGKDVNMTGVAPLPICLDDRYLARNDDRTLAMRAEVQKATLKGKTKTVLADWGAVWGYLDKKNSSRRMADEFLARSCVVQRHTFPPDQYWQALREHRFLMAPSGQGVYTRRVMEALMTLTIPIAQRVPNAGAFEELRDVYGWPIVIVDRWDEITRASLQRWWRELSPQLYAARMRLTADHWFSKVMGV